MGGLFPEGKEANFSRPDPGATVFCLANWTKKSYFVDGRLVNGLLRAIWH